MNKRSFFQKILGLIIINNFITIKKIMAEPKVKKTDTEWKKILTPEEYDILRKEGTEIAFTNALNDEKREGNFYCVACNSKLFSSSMKYDSGTGWPSFFNTYPNSLEMKTDYKLMYPRTEYHCANCGGHQGHLFDDGPKPTGKRYCNNGVCLKFIPEKV